MTVLVIRSNKRFAVRRSVTVSTTLARQLGGLMIELSSEGCRISNTDSTAYMIDQEVIVELDGEENLPGRVRWAHDGFVGVKFARALRQVELAGLLEVSRAPEYRAEVA